MFIRRRAVLAGSLLLPLRPASAREPAPPSLPDLLARPDGLMALTWLGRGAVVLPATARPLRALTLDGLSLVTLAVPAGPGLELLALCGLGDGRPRLLGLEVLRWRGPGGAHLDTRFTEISDRRRIALRRDAAAPRDAVRWRRAEWTDYLAWQPPLLADAPVRPPPEGTWQAALAVLRRRVQDWLASPRDALTTADIAALGLRAEAVVLAVG